MIVDRILRCYPKAWRERYEEELREIVASERLSLGVVVDLLSGALDARLHPNLLSGPQRGVLIPAGGATLFSGEYPPRRGATQVALGVVSWIGWTALAAQAIGAVFYILAFLGLLPHPLQGSGSPSGLLWLQMFGSPLAGNVGIRRMIHAGVGWRHGPRTLRAWVVLAVVGTVAYGGLFNLLWVLGVRPV
jgi:hypothetical protein